MHFLKASWEHLRIIFPPNCQDPVFRVISHCCICLHNLSLAFQIRAEVSTADDIKHEAFPTAGSAALSSPQTYHLLFFRTVSVRLKPIVARATGMNAMVTPLLFSLSIKSKKAHAQFTVHPSGTPPLNLCLFSAFKKIITVGFNYLARLAVFWHSHLSKAIVTIPGGLHASRANLGVRPKRLLIGSCVKGRVWH